MEVSPKDNINNSNNNIDDPNDNIDEPNNSKKYITAKVTATAVHIGLNSVSKTTVRKGLKYCAKKAITNCAKGATKRAAMKFAFKGVNRFVTYGIPGLNVAMMAWDAYDIYKFVRTLKVVINQIKIFR